MLFALLHVTAVLGSCPFDWGKCSAFGKVCDIMLGGGPVVSTAGCIADDAAVVATCEAAGLGPEDPMADTCAAVFATVFTTACKAAIKAGEKGLGEFGKAACKDAAGCSCLNGRSVEGRSVERVPAIDRLERLIHDLDIERQARNSLADETKNCNYIDDTWDWCRWDQVKDLNHAIIPRNNEPYKFKISMSEHFPWYCGSSTEYARIYRANTIIATVSNYGRIHWLGYYCW